MPALASGATFMAENLVVVLKHKDGKEVEQYLVTVCQDERSNPETVDYK